MTSTRNSNLKRMTSLLSGRYSGDSLQESKRTYFVNEGQQLSKAVHLYKVISRIDIFEEISYNQREGL